MCSQGQHELWALAEPHSSDSNPRAKCTRERAASYCALRPEMSQPAWPWAHLPSTKHNIFSESLLREDLWIVKELWWSSGLWYGQLCCCEANLGLQLFKPLQVWSVTDEDQLSGTLLSAVSHRLEKCCWWDWTALVSVSGSQRGIGPSASEKRGKMLGWNKRCYFLDCPSEGAWRFPTSNFSSCAAVSFL